MRTAYASAALALFLALTGCSPAKTEDHVTSPAASGGLAGSPALDAVREKLVAVVSGSPGAMPITWDGSQLSVSIENSALNAATHSARNSEATTIANTIGGAVANLPEFAGLLSVHVQYVAREAGANTTAPVDTIDFRKDALGRMTLHTT